MSHFSAIPSALPLGLAGLLVLLLMCGSTEGVGVEKASAQAQAIQKVEPENECTVKPILVGSAPSACPLAAFQLLAAAPLRLVTAPCVRSSVLAHQPPISDVTVQ